MGYRCKNRNNINGARHGKCGKNVDKFIFNIDDLVNISEYNFCMSSSGQEHVISVTGYFCKLCHKFYNNEAMAKVNHCKTEVHFEKYKVS